jgi:tetraacyldisaccharide 4'-kinase
MEIVVVDGARRFGNGRLLPAGPLREPVTRLNSVDAVIVNGVRAGGESTAGAVVDVATGKNEILMSLQSEAAVQIAGGATRPLSDFAPLLVHAVAGIGNPERFFRMLEAQGLRITRHPFPDHHAFQLADVTFADGHPVLMTEKDAVKCEQFAQPAHWYVPVEARLPAGQGQKLVESILALLGQ